MVFFYQGDSGWLWGGKEKGPVKTGPWGSCEELRLPQSLAGRPVLSFSRVSMRCAKSAEGSCAST